MNDFNANSAPDSNAHVVILLNYVRRHHVLAYQELAKRVKKLTILLSTPMEPNRQWVPEWDGLDVRVQKSWMFTARWKHSSGFEAPNFIHIPIDTNSQLKKLKPDIIFSYEFGMRSLFCCWYSRWHRDVPLVLVGNMSESVETERGRMRRLLRHFLRRNIRYFTYNGPSCKRYLLSLGVSEEQLFHVPYCFDRDKAFLGPKQFSRDGTRRMVYAGGISGLKGVLQFAHALQTWSSKNPGRPIEFTICGEGPQQDEVARCQTAALKINFLGNCNSHELRSAYQNADMCVFPTLADEWGLVPVEAMASGLPVLGSRLAQSIEELCQDGRNGWTFLATNTDEMFQAINTAMSTEIKELEAMSRAARKSIEFITPERSASKFFQVVESLTKLRVSAENTAISQLERVEF